MVAMVDTRILTQRESHAGILVVPPDSAIPEKGVSL